MTWLDLGLRLLLALAAGVALGLEREVRGHPAGLRTHVLVSVGSAMFTLAGAYGFADIIKSEVIDPARVAAQVASGIGFIGAGAILRNGASIKGLTTAATLWLAASVGVMAGAGNVPLVAMGTGLVLLTLIGLPYLRPSRWTSKEPVTIILSCAIDAPVLAAVLNALRSSSYRIGDIDIEDDRQAGERRVTVHVGVSRRLRHEVLVQRLSAVAELRSIAIHADEENG